MHPPCQAAKRTIPPEQWEQRLAQVSVSKDDMNRLVMDFLVTEVSHSANNYWMYN